MGSGTVVEHCHANVTSDHGLCTGKGCVVCGLWGVLCIATAAYDASISDHTVFQTITLSEATEGGEGKSHRRHRHQVYIYLNVREKIKEYDTVCCVSIGELLDTTGLDPREV